MRDGRCLYGNGRSSGGSYWVIGLKGGGCEGLRFNNWGTLTYIMT